MRVSDLDPAQLADVLKPYIVSWVRSASAAGAASLAAHALDGSHHTGTLGDDQAPQFLLSSGARPLAGNLSVAAGVTIDGVDISVHAGNPDAHHTTATAGAGIAVIGQQISVSLATNPGLTTASGLAVFLQSNPGLILGATGLAVRLQTDSGLILGATGLAMGAPSTLTTSTTNSVTTSTHTHAITTTADGDLLRNTILRTDASGVLRVTEMQSGLLSWPGAITIAPTTDVILSPGSNLVKLSSGRMIQSDNYASQATGMRVTHAGEGDFRYLYTDEMHAKSFIADLEQALAGGQIISKSVAVVAETFTLPAAGVAVTVRFRDLPSAPNMAVFQSGDWVAFRSFSRAGGSLTVGWAWGQVTSYADGTGGNEGTQTWTWTRNAGTPGAATGTIAADALALDFGVSGNGYYEVNAIDGAYAQNSPYWRITTWSSHPATQTVRVQGGNLRGLFGQADEYGFYAGDGTTTSSKYLRLSNIANEIRNLPLEWYAGTDIAVQIKQETGIKIRAATSGGADMPPGIAWLASVPSGNLLGSLIVQDTNSAYMSQFVTGYFKDAAYRVQAYRQNGSGTAPAIVLEHTATTGAIYLEANAVRINMNNVLHVASNDTITGVFDFQGFSTWCSHGYHRTYDGANVYVHYYPSGGNGGSNTYANFRVWNGVAQTYRTLFFGGNGAFQWEGATVYTTANLTISNYALLTGASFSGGVAAESVSTPQVIVSGAYSAVTIYDRDGDGQAWLEYHSGSVLRWYNPSYGDRMTLSYAGELSIAGSITTPYLYVNNVNGALGSWADFSTWGSGWGNYGSVFPYVQYRRWGDIVYVRGMAVATSSSPSTVICQLPYTLSYQHIVACIGSFGGTQRELRVDVLTNGQISIASAGATPTTGQWISLEFQVSLY